MPFEIIRNVITLVYADAIVNTANPQPVIGGGTGAEIHAAADLALLEPWEEIGPIAVGEAAITPALGKMKIRHPHRRSLLAGRRRGGGAATGVLSPQFPGTGLAA